MRKCARLHHYFPHKSPTPRCRPRQPEAGHLAVASADGAQHQHAEVRPPRHAAPQPARASGRAFARRRRSRAPSRTRSSSCSPRRKSWAPRGRRAAAPRPRRAHPSASAAQTHTHKRAARRAGGAVPQRRGRLEAHAPQPRPPQPRPRVRFRWVVPLVRRRLSRVP